VVRGVDVGCRHAVLLLGLLATLVLFEVYGKPYSQQARVGGRSFPSVLERSCRCCTLSLSRLTRGAADVNIENCAYCAPIKTPCRPVTFMMDLEDSHCVSFMTANLLSYQVAAFTNRGCHGLPPGDPGESQISLG